MADTAPKIAITVAIIGLVGVIGSALIQKYCQSPETNSSDPESLRVTAVPIHIDFTPRPVMNRGPGCVCGAGDIAFEGGPYTVSAKKEFTFRYDGANVCRGQAFDKFSGSINWGGPSTRMPNNTRNDEFPGIAGALRVIFSKPGDYNVVSEFTLDCIDFGLANCRQACRASGTTEVHVK